MPTQSPPETECRLRRLPESYILPTFDRGGEGNTERGSGRLKVTPLVKGRETKSLVSRWGWDSFWWPPEKVNHFHPSVPCDGSFQVVQLSAELTYVE